ncbi:hypothetical protein BH09BAC6_BH09BAC6_11100 [soil metagenome]|jgi:hypothetical protein
MKNLKNASKRSLAGMVVVGLLSLLLSSCLKDNNTYYVPPAALVTFIQASPGQPPMDLYLDNNRVAHYPVYYTNQVDYFRAFTGKRNVNLYYTGTTNKIFSDTVTLKQDVAYSLFLANTTAHPDLVLLIDSVAKPSTGNASVRFVNLSPDAPAVDFAVKGSAPLVTNKAYKGHSSFIPVPGNVNYSFEVRQKGISTVLATLVDVNLTTGFVYTIYFHGLAAGTTSNDKLAADIVTNAFYY